MAATATAMSYDDEFAFWTTERIRKAIPADQFLSADCTAQQQVASSPGPSQTYQPTSAAALPRLAADGSDVSGGRVHEISLDELTTAPYQSIGRLTVHGEYTDTKGNVISQDRYATAFYIGNSTLLTAAHVFCLGTFKETKGAVFIPAMIAPDQVDPCKNYGKFLVRPGRLGGYFLHPKYDSVQRKAQYDICKVTICKGVKDNKLIDSIDNIGLRPLIVHKDENYTPQTAWRIIGYPSIPPTPPKTFKYLNSKDSIVTGMFEVGGIYKCSDQEKLILDTEVEILRGVSGGPWIMGAGATMQEANMIVNGVQAGNNDRIDDQCTAGNPIDHADTAVSPYFSTDLFRKMKLQVDDGNIVDMEVVP